MGKVPVIKMMNKSLKKSLILDFDLVRVDQNYKLQKHSSIQEMWNEIKLM